MQLTRFTDLGFRILMRLAVADQDDAVLTTRSLASQLAVKYSHAAKVVTRLQRLDVVKTRRGRHGGLSITEHGRTITVGRIARDLEGHDEVVECEGSTPCPLRDVCHLRELLRDAQEAFFRELDRYTIDDLTHRRTAQVLLSLSARPPE